MKDVRPLVWATVAKYLCRMTACAFVYFGICDLKFANDKPVAELLLAIALLLSVNGLENSFSDWHRIVYGEEKQQEKKKEG